MIRINETLLLPFRFYLATADQNRYWNECDEISVHEVVIITNNKSLLPFMVRRSAIAGAPVHTMKIICYDTLAETDLSGACFTADMNYKLGVEMADGTWDYIWYNPLPENCMTTWNIPEGIYYAEYSDGTSTWYSELFKVVDFDSDDFARVWNSLGEYRDLDSGDIRIHK